MKIKPGLEEEYRKYVEANQDPYGGEVVKFGERWADLMEKAMDEPPSLKYVDKSIEEVTSHEADTEGITGFMYGAAAAALSHFWIHGDQFKRWHNAKQGGTGDEESVINPAIITIDI